MKLMHFSYFTPLYTSISQQLLSMTGVSSITESKKLSLFSNTSFVVLLSFFLTINLHPSSAHLFNQSIMPTSIILQSHIAGLPFDGCSDLHTHHGYKAKCVYVKNQNGCQPEGYLHYLQFFYCNCGGYPALGFVVLVLWLVVLFYLLGDTTANYFCYPLENLSRVLNLPPTIAGVTLLALGNGAPDLFSSIISFVGAGAGEVALNSVLGGAFFVSSTVVGIISISISSHEVSIDKSSFIRDVLFFILSLSVLLVILIVGKIDMWGAVSYVSLYLVYVFIVSMTHLWRDKQKVMAHNPEVSGDLGRPLVNSVGDENFVLIENGSSKENDHKARKSICFGSSSFYFGRFLHLLVLPLSFPRRLTIPVVSDERWSKPFAVISVTLAPVLLAVIWNSKKEIMLGPEARIVIYLLGGLIGLTNGVHAFLTTEVCKPPKRCLLPWLAGGFLMSITWTYLIAQELVALLVSLGSIFEIRPSILGLTLLAWGNSLNDLITNVTMAIRGGPAGAQIAISGCYAGPMFNTLMGLGLSLVFSCWYEYPSPYVIPRDPSLYETLGFLLTGLLWTLLILPNKNMRLDKFLGVGLLAIYICFLSVRLGRVLGLLQLP